MHYDLTPAGKPIGFEIIADEKIHTWSLERQLAETCMISFLWYKYGIIRDV